MNCILLGRIIVLTASLAVSGCVTIQQPDFVTACPKLQMPPMPQKAKILINGDSIEVDKGGEEIIRGYVDARALLK